MKNKLFKEKLQLNLYKIKTKINIRRISLKKF